MPGADPAHDTQPDGAAAAGTGDLSGPSGDRLEQPRHPDDRGSRFRRPQSRYTSEGSCRSQSAQQSPCCDAAGEVGNERDRLPYGQPEDGAQGDRDSRAGLDTCPPTPARRPTWYRRWAPGSIAEVALAPMRQVRDQRQRLPHLESTPGKDWSY